ncbi:MAG TPA: SRPBCC family protein, partial [Kiloniellales bacterium]|nr:SRPBCC family protein [Kiloniellales bacterium]
MVQVARSTIIEAPVEAVWQFLRDFNAHEDWHPAVAESRIEEGRTPDQAGAVRRFKLVTGGELREQLLALDDDRRRLTYCILDAPLALIGYVATIELKPVTDGNRTFWSWRSDFAAPPGEAETLARLVGEEIYEAGFDAVKRHFGQAATARRRAVAAPAVGSGTAIPGHAIVLERHGGPEVLRWQEMTAPPPGPGELRLRQSAVGVNYIDVYCRTGYFPLLQPGGVPGMEAAGAVVDVGPGVEGLVPGDRVAYAGPPLGAYATVRTLPVELVVPLPDWLDELTAAAVLLKGLTAEFLLHRVAPVGERDTILVQAAAGGVGSLLSQWASQLGATVIGTVGSAEKARLALANGCAHAILSREIDYPMRVLELTQGRGV